MSFKLMNGTQKFFAFTIPILLTLGIAHQIHLKKKAKTEYKKFNEAVIKGVFENTPRTANGATYFRVNNVEFMIHPDKHLPDLAGIGDSIIKEHVGDKFYVIHHGQKTEFQVLRPE